MNIPRTLRNLVIGLLTAFLSAFQIFRRGATRPVDRAPGPAPGPAPGSVEADIFLEVVQLGRGALDCCPACRLQAVLYRAPSSIPDEPPAFHMAGCNPCGTWVRGADLGEVIDAWNLHARDLWDATKPDAPHGIPSGMSPEMEAIYQRGDHLHGCTLTRRPKGLPAGISMLETSGPRS